MPLTTPIIQILERDTLSVDVSQSVSEAWKILLSGRIHHLPVVRGTVLAGLLSTTDMLALRASVPGSDEQETLDFVDAHYRIADLMQTDVISISDQATVGDAARQLSAGGFHSLPVVSKDGSLVGIVTTTDLIGFMLEATGRAVAGEAGPRQRALERVYSAAQAYFHSGMAAQEHRKLEQALEAVRASREGVTL